jgi:poly(A) polymerase Pap1
MNWDKRMVNEKLWQRIFKLDELFEAARDYVNYTDAANARDWETCDLMESDSNTLYEKLKVLVRELGG